MSEYDDLMRSLLVERFQPPVAPRRRQHDPVDELSRATQRERRQTADPPRRKPTNGPRAERSPR